MNKYEGVLGKMRADKMTRYQISMGLAFDEEGDMRKLSKLASEGWLLQSFASLGYRLRRDQPQQLIYCVDYRELPAGEREQYLELFEASGWKPVCSHSSMHVFSAKPGTKPIYTDKSTMRSKYTGITKACGWVLGISGALALGLGLLSSQVSDKVNPSMEYLLMMISALAIGTAVAAGMTFAAFRFRLHRLR